MLHAMFQDLGLPILEKLLKVFTIHVYTEYRIVYSALNIFTMFIAYMAI